jgi:hypothetical protein
MPKIPTEGDTDTHLFDHFDLTQEQLMIALWGCVLSLAKQVEHLLDLALL